MFDVIRGAEIFSGVPLAKLNKLAALATAVDVSAGTHLFRLGDQAESLFILERGKVDLTIPLTVLGVEKDVSIQSVAPGEALAWSSLVKPHVLTSSARVVEDSRLARLAASDLLDLLDSDPEIASAVRTRLCELVARRLQQVQAMWIREIQHHIRERYG